MILDSGTNICTGIAECNLRHGEGRKIFLFFGRCVLGYSRLFELARWHVAWHVLDHTKQKTAYETCWRLLKLRPKHGSLPGILFSWS